MPAPSVETSLVRIRRPCRRRASRFGRDRAGVTRGIDLVRRARHGSRDARRQRDRCEHHAGSGDHDCAPRARSGTARGEQLLDASDEERPLLRHAGDRHAERRRLDPFRDLREAAGQRDSGSRPSHRPLVAEVLGRGGDLAPRDAIERLDPEYPLEDAREAEPERIAPREVRELVREHAALLLLVQLRQRRLRHTDLGYAERDRARDTLGAREARAPSQSRFPREEIQLGEQLPIAYREAVADASHQDQAPRSVSEGEHEPDEPPRQHRGGVQRRTRDERGRIRHERRRCGRVDRTSILGSRCRLLTGRIIGSWCGDNGWCSGRRRVHQRHAAHGPHLEGQLDRRGHESADERGLPHHVQRGGRPASSAGERPCQAKQRRAVDQVREQPGQHRGGERVDHLDSPFGDCALSINRFTRARSPGLMSDAEMRCETSAAASPANNRSVSSLTIECWTSGSVIVAR